MSIEGTTTKTDSLPMVCIRDATLELHPERAVYWVEENVLLVSDLHIGKAATFRQHGIPIPRGTTEDDLRRLSRLLKTTGAERLIVLGDLFHGAAAQDGEFVDVLQRWNDRHRGLERSVVPGNHDERAGLPDPMLGWRVLGDNYPIGPFRLRHYPGAVPGSYVLAGHLHPVFRVRDGRESVRLPCFHFGKKVGTLPAFSLFTGGARIRPAREDQVYVPAGSTVVRII